MNEKVQKQKKVILTIDTEGPRGTDPVLYQIWGKVGDEYYGVPKIIEICETMLVQLVNCIPAIFGIYLIFDFLGSILFGKGR